MKILMRADTHYSIGVRSNEYEKPNYTFSQIDRIEKIIKVYGDGVDGLTPSVTSPINYVVSSPSSTFSSSEELNNKCQDLISLLNSTQEGKLLLKQRLSPLGDQLRRTLTREIATEIVKHDPKAPITSYICSITCIGFAKLVLAAVAVSMGSMIIGFSSAYTSPALVTMENSTTISVTKEEASWIGSLMPLAALLGGIIGGPLVDYIGRRKTILFTAFPFFLGWILIATAKIVHLVLAGRVICGLCVGIGSLAFPVYLGETIQPEVRGTLGLFPTAIGNIGILICYLAGKYLDWSELAYLGACLPIPFFILMLMIPETPQWYLSNGRTDDARKALQWLRGKNAKIDNEMRDMAMTNADMESDASSIKELFSRKYMKSILISLGLMTFQQLSGINAVIFYTVSIFKMSGSAVDENLSTIIVGIVNFVSTFIATAFIDRAGRKVLLYISSVTMTITLVILGTFFYVQKNLKMDVSTLGWLPLTSIMVYLLGFSLAFGPIPWLMMGEILPAKIRGAAASICTAFNWLCTFTVTKTFLNIIDGIGPAGTFWLFGCVCFVGLFFVVVCVPETRGKSLEQIETKLTGRTATPRTRRMSSIANIKPLPNGC